MKRYRRTLPPLDTLIFFEAAARHESFSAAATELLVTQAAVSKRVRQLEDHLNVALFRRNGRVIDLTAEGRNLADKVAILLDFADTTLARVGERSDAPVRISANTTVSMFWLPPRLRAFGLSELSCAVETVTSDVPATVANPENDISILHGDGTWPDRSAILLFPDKLVPVVLAGLAHERGLTEGMPLSAIPPERRPDLLNFPRITPEWTNWENWAFTAETKGWSVRQCETYARSIGAAFEGRGVALVSPDIFADELRDRTLVQLGPMSHSRTSAYYLTFADQDTLRPNVRTLIEFLKGPDI